MKLVNNFMPVLSQFSKGSIGNYSLISLVTIWLPIVILVFFPQEIKAMKLYFYFYV